MMMSEWIQQAGAWTLRNSVEGGVLIVLVAVVLLTGHRWLSPRVRAFIWGIAAIRLILPFAPESGFSLFNLVQFSDTDPLVSSGLAGTSPTMEYDILIAEEETASPSGPATSGFDWVAMSGLAWLAGALAILGIGLCQQVRAMLRVRRMPEPADEGLLRIFRDCLQRTGLDRAGIRLAESPRAGEIAVFGWFRARRVLVPADLMRSYNVAEVRGILLHELAHVRRCDLLRNWITLIVQAIHWFNPLAWWVGSRLRAEREIICDQLALEDFDSNDRRQYGLALLRTLQAGNTAPRACPAFVPFLFKKSELKHRLTMIKKPHYRKRPLVHALAICVAATACAATFTSAVAQENKSERSREENRSKTVKTNKEQRANERKASDRVKIPLDVYLGTRGAYISGQNLDLKNIGAMVREFGGDGVILTVEQGVDKTEREEVLAAIRNAGAPSVKVKVHVPLSEMEKKRQVVEKVEGRLEGHEGPLGIYMNSRGVWIKGTQLPSGVLSEFARVYGKNGIVLSAEPEVTKDRLKMIVDQIREGGVKDIKITSPPK